MRESVLDVDLDHVPLREGVYDAIVGANRKNVNYICEATSAEVKVIGRGSDEPDYETGLPSARPLQIIIRHRTEDGLLLGKIMIKTLLDTVQKKFAHFEKPEVIYCGVCKISVSAKWFDQHCGSLSHKQALEGSSQHGSRRSVPRDERSREENRAKARGESMRTSRENSLHMIAKPLIDLPSSPSSSSSSDENSSSRSFSPRRTSPKRRSSSRQRRSLSPRSRHRSRSRSKQRRDSHSKYSPGYSSRESHSKRLTHHSSKHTHSRSRRRSSSGSSGSSRSSSPPSKRKVSSKSSKKRTEKHSSSRSLPHSGQPTSSPSVGYPTSSSALYQQPTASYSGATYQQSATYDTWWQHNQTASAWYQPQYQQPSQYPTGNDTYPEQTATDPNVHRPDVPAASYSQYQYNTSQYVQSNSDPGHSALTTSVAPQGEASPYPPPQQNASWERDYTAPGAWNSGTNDVWNGNQHGVTGPAGHPQVLQTWNQSRLDTPGRLSTPWNPYLSEPTHNLPGEPPPPGVPATDHRHRFDPPGGGPPPGGGHPIDHRPRFNPPGGGPPRPGVPPMDHQHQFIPPGGGPPRPGVPPMDHQHQFNSPGGGPPPRNGPPIDYQQNALGALLQVAILGGMSQNQVATSNTDLDKLGAKRTVAKPKKWKDRKTESKTAVLDEKKVAESPKLDPAVMDKLHTMFENQVSDTNREQLIEKCGGGTSEVDLETLPDDTCKICYHYKAYREEREQLADKTRDDNTATHWRKWSHKNNYLELQLQLGLKNFAKLFPNEKVDGMDTKGGTLLAVIVVQGLHAMPADESKALRFKEVIMLAGKINNYYCVVCKMSLKNKNGFAQHVTKQGHAIKCMQLLAADKKDPVMDEHASGIIWPNPTLLNKEPKWVIGKTAAIERTETTVSKRK